MASIRTNANTDMDMRLIAIFVQLTFREQWNDDRLQYDDMTGKIRSITLTDPKKIWMPDAFFANEKEGKFHEIIMPNVLLRIYPNGNITTLMFATARAQTET
uniref:Neurotransmitter-gated ion-channel ligand-binding domain-containing protein n=1 Tax=Strigamia maritima TaxID=126957 RepID=T1JPF6_STRMM